MIYAISLILQGTIGLNQYHAIVLIGVITLIYSAMGGMRAVAADSMTMDQLREQVREELLVSKLRRQEVMSKVSVSDEDVDRLAVTMDTVLGLLIR